METVTEIADFFSGSISIKGCPKTAADIDEATGRENVARDKFVRGHLSSTYLPQLKDSVAEEASKKVGVEIPKDSDGKPTVSSVQFINELLATEKISLDALVELAQDMADENPPSYRGATRGKIGQHWLDLAELFAEVHEGNELKKQLANIKKKCGIQVPVDDKGKPSKLVLATALKTLDDLATAQNLASLGLASD